MKKFYKSDESFICENCGKEVEKLNYTSRDHCPYCLYSKHVDINPGDRMNTCKGLLKPIGIEKFKETEYGKKTNKMLYISAPFGIIALIFYVLITTKVIELGDSMLSFAFGLIFIAVIIMCYFDGKRDGAIEQFKRKK